jgi:ABC-type branched-subunit amino acid transport system ATPase component
LKLKAVVLRNFLSFGPQETRIAFKDYNVIVGPNAAGKTNLLRAFSVLRAAAQPFGIGSGWEYHHLGATEFELRFEIDLSQEEVSAIGDFMTCLPMAENFAVAQGQDQTVAQRQAFDIASQLKESLATAFTSTALILQGWGRERGAPEISVELHGGGSTFRSNQYGIVRLIGEVRTGGPAVQFGRFLLDSLMNADPRREVGNQFFAMLTRALHDQYFALQLPQISSLANLENNPITEQCARRLMSFLRLRNHFEDNVSIGGLILAIFSDSIVEVSERRLRPTGFTPLPEDQIPAAHRPQELWKRNLALDLFQLKNGVEAKRDRYAKVREAFNNILGSRYDFDVVLRTRQETAMNVVSGVGDVSRTATKHDVAIEVNDGKGWVHLDFAAAGLYELLAILFVVIGEPDKLLLLDEPALNLHPVLQLEVRRTLERSLTDSNNQVILLTHSPFMVSTGEGVVVMRFFRGVDGTEVVVVRDGTERAGPKGQHGGAISEIDWATTLFAAGLVIVEGPSDKYVIEHLDQKLPTGTRRILDQDWIAIASHGKQGIPAVIDLARKVKMPYVILTDADTVMECSATFEGHPIPSLFRYLRQSDMLSESDSSSLGSLETTLVERTRNGRAEKTTTFKKEDFPRIKSLAARYQIYVLPGTLEDILGLVDGGRRKFRDVLELVDSEYGQKPIPEEIRGFFEYANSIKTPTTR